MILLDSLYFPCISYCQVMVKQPVCIIEQHEYFRKMSFRNRCIIVGSNGLINLTIPVVGGRNNKNIMKDVRISYSEDWSSQHWKGIVSSYAKSPYFDYYQSDIERIIKMRHSFLMDKNIEIYNWLKKVLKLTNSFELSSEFSMILQDGIIDYRNKCLPNNYLDTDIHLPKYFQIFEDKLGFQKNLSVLDLLFCEGNNAKYLLT